MSIYDIINQLELLINENNKGKSLVLHRNMQQSPVVPVYKRFNYTLYLIKGKEKVRLIEKSFMDKCPVEKLEEIWNKQDILFTFCLLQWMGTDEYKNLRYGIQQTSDVDN